jgi:malonyl CoA-acyl carrier protein transacylase
MRRALASSGSISWQVAIRLAYERGLCMEQNAVISDKQGTFGMLACFIRPQDLVAVSETLQEIPKEAVCIANYNSSSQIVLAGVKADIFQAVNLLKQRKLVLKSKSLDTSIPFHSPHLKSSALEFSQVLKSVEFSDFHIPVISNVTALPVDCLIRNLCVLVFKYTRNSTIA